MNGDSLQLLGQFLAPVDNYITSYIKRYATRPRAHMATSSLKPTSWHANVPFCIPRDLNTTSHVFLRQDHDRRALEALYAGRFKSYNNKHFFLFQYEATSLLSRSTLSSRHWFNQLSYPISTTTSTTSPATTTGTDERQEEKRAQSGRRVRLPNCYRP